MTATAYLIALELLRYADRRGICWPSLQTLATGAGCCVRTASRAIAALRDAGLLTWRQRPGRWNRRLSNAYALLVPREIPIRVRSLAAMSIGSPSPTVLGALARLGAALRVPPEAVMPWLSVADPPAEPS